MSCFSDIVLDLQFMSFYSAFILFLSIDLQALEDNDDKSKVTTQSGDKPSEKGKVEPVKKDPENAGLMNSVKSEKEEEGEQDSEQDDPTGISLPGNSVVPVACGNHKTYFN